MRAKALLLAPRLEGFLVSSSLMVLGALGADGDAGDDEGDDDDDE